MSEAICPFCQHTVTSPWCTSQTEDGTAFDARSCQACHTTFLWPPPTDAQLTKAYATNYYGEGAAKFNPRIERLRDTFANLRARQLINGLPPDACILDVGCGDGRLLRTFHRAGFRQLHGIELPGRAAERAGTIPGLHLHLGTLASLDLPAASFDLISLVHVYEHLPAPRETLDKLARLIKPGGRLFLSFPNISSWQARWFAGAWFHLDAPRHLTLVPPALVIRHLQAQGFVLDAQQHLNLEQNIYGWIQSALNRVDSRRNFLYERLKRNRAYLPGRKTGSVLLHAGVAGLMLAPSILLDVGAAAAGAGATVELMFSHHPKR